MKQNSYIFCQENIKGELNIAKSFKPASAATHSMVVMKPGEALCKSCGSVTTYSLTSCKDIVIQCSENKCKRYICTINRCFETFLRPTPAHSHQQHVHRAIADPSKCFFCNTFKDRTTGKESAQCPKCGIFWCLFKNCTFESVKLTTVNVHIVRENHRTPLQPQLKISNSEFKSSQSRYLRKSNKWLYPKQQMCTN